MRQGSETVKEACAPRGRWRAWMMAFCLGLGLLVAKAAWAQTPFGQSLDNSTMEDYIGAQLAGRIYIKRAFVDHAQFGFFKLGLAPVPVAEGVQIQIRSADSLTNILEGLGSWNISPVKLRHLEFRNLEISLLSERGPQLRAGKARLVQPGILELSQISVSNPSQGAVSLRKAALQMAGPDCGCLSWNEGGRREELPVFQTKKN